MISWSWHLQTVWTAILLNNSSETITSFVLCGPLTMQISIESWSRKRWFLCARILIKSRQIRGQRSKVTLPAREVRYCLMYTDFYALTSEIATIQRLKVSAVVVVAGAMRWTAESRGPMTITKYLMRDSANHQCESRWKTSLAGNRRVQPVQRPQVSFSLSNPKQRGSVFIKQRLSLWSHIFLWSNKISAECFNFRSFISGSNHLSVQEFLLGATTSTKSV